MHPPLGFHTRTPIILLPGLLWVLSTIPLFAQTDFSKIDQHVRQVEMSNEMSPQEIAISVSAPFESEVEKIRAIYSWIVMNISYDERSLKPEELSYNYNTFEIIKGRRAVCAGFAHLFQSLSTYVGIPCEIIVGYAFGHDQIERSYDQPNHAWNAVWIHGDWKLIDITWATGLSALDDKDEWMINNEYFLRAPEIFIQDHLPQIQMWQLLNCPIQLAAFQSSDTDLSKSDTDPLHCITYIDSISSLLSLPSMDRKLKETRLAFQFNPSVENRNDLGQVLMDFVSTIDDTLNTKPATQDIEHIDWYLSRLIDLSQEAESLTKLFDWQREMYARLLLNRTIGRYNYFKTFKKSVPALLTSMNLDIQKARQLLTKVNNTFYKNQAMQQCDQIEVLIQGLIDQY
jgi:hypothetical protein